MSQIQAIRGMSDLLPLETATWQAIELILRDLLNAYGFAEIRVPIVERTDLFKRSIGEVTDVVEKEMYTFEDRNGESLTLRPEATAGIVRAGMTNGLLHNQRQKLWSCGPMFRYEKPQKGRYRQFHQFDIEALGYAGPDIDAELIIITSRIWRALGIDAVELELNSLGTAESRLEHRQALTAYFERYKDDLDADSRDRLYRNPLRILDSKNPDMMELVSGAPVTTDFLDAESEAHFSTLRQLLDQAGIVYRVNPRLVRGLDYYSKTVFEWVTDKLGAQGTICGGGRYDGLVSQLGGKPTPAIGCAIGMERLLELYKVCGGQPVMNSPDAYFVAVGSDVLLPAFSLVEGLRDEFPDIRVEMNCGGGSFKSQMKRADRSRAAVALILGEDEVAEKMIGIKALREDGGQISVSWPELGTALKQYIDNMGMGNNG
ncbi:MAG: histidine--tRNA ligase [Gammaproteobacteria bacterium]|jgi:histidyl-tRNA synthetase|nr:histidine--tRNA ligase [Chromatiales bacterium]MDP6674371.1 histidine--tRNA ligase [Gammaproteobacteria bacterium]